MNEDGILGRCIQHDSAINAVWYEAEENFSEEEMKGLEEYCKDIIRHANFGD